MKSVEKSNMHAHLTGDIGLKAESLMEQAGYERFIHLVRALVNQLEKESKGKKFSIHDVTIKRTL